MYTKEETLKNGVRVITSHLPDSHSATICIIFTAGSKNEHIPGLAHFIEHMVFKGTGKRPEASIINNEIESVGGYINAATSQEFTEYYVKVPNTFVPMAFELLSDLVLHSTFDAKEMEKEKDVVGEEIHMYDDMPIRNVSDTFYSLIWKSALGRAILGTRESVGSITREDILLFLEHSYTPANTIISIAGNLDHFDSFDLANRYFGDQSQSDTSYLPDEDTVLAETKKGVEYFEDSSVALRVEKRNVRQAHLCFGLKSLSYDDPMLYPLQVANGILAEGSGSFLWQKIREDMGASYYLNGEIDSFIDDGIWYFHTGIDEDKLEDVCHVFLEGYDKLIGQGVAPEELTRAKEYIKGDFLMNLEGSEEIAKYNGHELREHGCLKSTEEELRRIDEVTVDKIAQVVEKVFRGKLYVNVLTKSPNLNILKGIINH